MRHVTFAFVLLAGLSSTNSLRAQEPPGNGQTIPPASVIEQQIQALEAQNAMLMRMIGEMRALKTQLSNSVHEAHIDRTDNNQLGRPLPPGADRIERTHQAAASAGGGGRGWGGFGLSSYGGMYPYYSSRSFTTPSGNVSSSSGVIPAGSMLSAAMPARVTVMVSPGARVWFDGKQATTSNGRATFTSPPIPAGQTVMLAVTVESDRSTHKMNLSLQTDDNMTVDFRR